jgi:hypothetical protein
MLMCNYKVTSLKSAYCIIEDKSLILESYKGKFNVNELIAIKQCIKEDIFYDPNFNVIQDISEAIFEFKFHEISRLIELSSYESNINHRRSCMLTTTPNQVVMALGYDMLKKDLPVYIHVCSTLEEALHVVGVKKIDRSLIQQYLNKLKSQLTKAN